MDKKAGTKAMQSSIQQRWLRNSLSLVALILVAFILLASVGLATYYQQTVITNLSNRVQTTARFMNRYLSTNYTDFYSNAERITRDFSDKDKLDLQVIDISGKILFSSSNLSSGMTPGTKDVETCLNDQTVSSFSGINPLSDERILSVTAPLTIQENTTVGAVRVVTSMRLIERKLLYNILLIVLGCLLVFLLVIFSNNFFLRSILHPVLRLNEAAKEIARGQYVTHIEKEYDDEIGELCDTINYMSNEINKSEKIKNEFISSVSHELRTPLTAIGGWSETLLAGGLEDRQEAMVGLDIIHNEAGRLSQMVEELLSFSTLENNGLKLQMDVVDICGELGDVIYMYSSILKKQEIELSYTEPDEPVFVNGDRDRLKQVFINIIDNAVKYGGSGGKIDVASFVLDQNIHISIRDYGVGIPEDELPHVKERFFKGSSKQKGTGIGLTVCDEIVKMHGGSLDLHSTSGKGTTVIITLPIYVPPADIKTERAETHNE